MVRSCASTSLDRDVYGAVEFGACDLESSVFSGSAYMHIYIKQKLYMIEVQIQNIRFLYDRASRRRMNT